MISSLYNLGVVKSKQLKLLGWVKIKVTVKGNQIHSSKKTECKPSHTLYKQPSTLASSIQGIAVL